MPGNTKTSGSRSLAEVRLDDTLRLGDVVRFEWQADTGILYADSLLQEWLGLDGGPGAPMMFQQLVACTHSDDRPWLAARFKNALDGGGALEIEFRIDTTSDQLRWLVARAQPRVAADGKITGVAGVFIDITRAKLREAARQTRNARLRESAQLLRAIADTMPQLVWSADSNGYADYFNGRWFAYTGRSETDCVGDGWLEAVHPADYADARDTWILCRQVGEPYEAEFRLAAEDGSYRWFITRAVPFRNERGQIRRWFGTSTDIDHRKQIEAALRDSELRFRSLVELSPQMVWINRSDGEGIYANSFWHKYTGLTPDRVGGLRWLRVLHPEDRQRAGRTWLRAFASKRGYELELRVRRYDGVYRWFLVRGVPLHAESGPVDRWMGIAIDIDEQKEAERSLDLIGRELSHRIKNLFAVVDSLVMLSARHNPLIRDFTEELRARIGALARACDYVRIREVGERVRPTLDGLLHQLVEPFQQLGASRIRIDCVPVPVGSRAATAVALMVHELVTNAIKYGALSTADGSVMLDCSHIGERLVLRWTERDGPQLTGGPPARRGFGSLLLDSSARQLGGAISMDWSPRGLSVQLTAPLSRLAI